MTDKEKIQSGEPTRRINDEPIPKVDEEPIQQHAQAGWQTSNFVPVWMRQLPRIKLPKRSNPNFQLIDEKTLQKIKEKYDLDEESINKVRKEQEFLDIEIMGKFREMDVEAKVQQNSFKLYQIVLIILAMLATMAGSLQAIFLSQNPDVVPYLGIIETMIALFTIFVVTIGGSSKDSLQAWIESRRISERFRREYFRYLMDLPPYTSMQVDYERRQLLAKRAASIFNGDSPEEPSILEGGNS